MPKLLKPPRLRPGDLIGVVVPASPMKHDKLEQGIRYLENLGYRVKLGKYIFHEHGYLAGRDKERAADINNMFRDRKVKAIFCARGGYGTPRLLSLLDYNAIRANPKIFVGYSDITAIQLAMLRHAGLITFSGPMVAAEMGKGIDPFTEEKFWRILTHPEPLGDLRRPGVDNYQPITRGRAVGPLIGGCLSLVATLVGSPHFPEVKGSIFCLEEIGEAPYRIDRYLVQFREAGILRRIAGFVLGQTTDCVPTDDEPSLTIDDLLHDFIRPLKVPAVAGLDYGHVEVKYTLPVGIRAELIVQGDKSTLTIVESAVS
ncbi:MAG: LD-carboxypeptidase [candidate division KSB1 bacterium]|nr:LD-carboxypeptidase [candidate division KSB1 bacterium]MDZ7303558.1 LD-carboxypeptidase [candidate division KSB1 bacterium]MDZ7312801.1 LD-carboxypeptidase [candidate division KSB1 bacterium]